MARPDATLREMLIEVAPPQLRTAGRALVAAETADGSSGADDGMAYAEALTTWGDLGGYELEAQWAAAVQRVVKSPVDDVAHPARRRAVGRRAQAARARPACSTRGADVLLLDEPDNYLDIPTRWWLEEQLRQTQVDRPDGQPRPHAARRGGHQGDRHRGVGRWVHGGSYRHVPAGPRRAPGAARRRPAAVEGRGAPPVPPHEDHEAARRA